MAACCRKQLQELPSCQSPADLLKPVFTATAHCPVRHNQYLDHFPVLSSSATSGAGGSLPSAFRTLHLAPPRESTGSSKMAWVCASCTYFNETSQEMCEMCGMDRDSAAFMEAAQQSEGDVTFLEALTQMKSVTDTLNEDDKVYYEVRGLRCS